MKAYKRLTLLTFSAFIAVTIWRVFAPFLADQKPRADWVTYEKKEGELKSAPTTPEERERMRLAPVTPEQSAPAALDAKRDPAAVSALPVVEREVSGNEAQLFEKESNRFRYLNNINEDWQKQMAERLMRFQDERTKMYLKHEKGILQVQNGTAQYLEQVMVTFSMDDGTHYSYRALVDSEEGRILETWDRTKHETPMRFKRGRGKLVPTGSL